MPKDFKGLVLRSLGIAQASQFYKKESSALEICRSVQNLVVRYDNNLTTDKFWRMNMLH